MLNQGLDEISPYIEKRYDELRNEMWSDESLNKMIDEYEKMVFNSGAYLRDIDRWPESVQQENDLRLSLFREYVLSRADWMDKYIESLTD